MLYRGRKIMGPVSFYFAIRPIVLEKKKHVIISATISEKSPPEIPRFLRFLKLLDFFSRKLSVVSRNKNIRVPLFAFLYKICEFDDNQIIIYIRQPFFKMAPKAPLGFLGTFNML